MSRSPTVTRANLDRALAALKAAGIDVARVELRPDGKVVILTAAGAPVIQEAGSALDRWRENKRGAGAA